MIVGTENLSMVANNIETHAEEVGAETEHQMNEAEAMTEDLITEMILDEGTEMSLTEDTEMNLVEGEMNLREGETEIPKDTGLAAILKRGTLHSTQRPRISGTKQMIIMKSLNMKKKLSK